MKWHWSYTSQPYRIFGISHPPFLWGVLLFFILIVVKPSLPTSVFLVVFYIACLIYSKKNSIPINQIPHRILNNFIGRDKLVTTAKDARKYERK